MTRSELNSLIERRKKELDSDYVFIPQYYPLSDFCKNHFISKPEDFIGYDMKYLLKVLYFSQTLNPNPSEKEAERIVDRIVYPVVSGMDYQSLSHTIYISEIIADSGEGEKVVRYLKEKSSIKSKIMSFDLKLREDIIDNLTSLKSHADSINFPIAEFFELYFEDQLLINNMMNVYYAAGCINRDVQEIHERLAGALSDLNAPREVIRNANNLKKKYIKQGLSSLTSLSEVFALFNRISEGVRKIDKEAKDYAKNKYRELSNLDLAVSILDEGLQKKEITDVLRILYLIKDPEIKRAFLEIIYEHNAKYYKELSKEYESLNGKSNVKYQVLLSDYGIKVDSKSIEAIMYNSLEEVEDILKIISKTGLSSDILFKILKSTDLATVKEIKGYIDRGILSDEFILGNFDVFCSDSPKYLLLKNNILLFESYSLNPNMFTNNGNILIGNSLLLQNNLDILKSYDLLGHLKTTTSYLFLVDSELLVKVERLLELGYEKFLEEDLGILNVCDIKRLEVLNSLNMPVQDLETFYSVCQSKRFFIRDEEMDSYLLNVLDFKEEVDLGINSSNLEEYRVSSRLYNINGVLVAVNKVNRLLSEGNSMYQAIFEGMILNEEEYSTVMSSLVPVQYQ